MRDYAGANVLPSFRLPGPIDAIVLPTKFEDDEERNGTIDVVIIGESSAEGVPFNLFGMTVGRLVADRLQEALGGRKVLLHRLAFSGRTLEEQHETLRTALKRRPEVLIVYAGHNQFAARIFWSRTPPYYSDSPPPSIWRRCRGGC